MFAIKAQKSIAQKYLATPALTVCHVRDYFHSHMHKRASLTPVILANLYVSAAG